MSTYRISQLAERSGVPATTLRFYEDAGLLPAGRTPAGYRVYGEDAVERLAFISSGKLLGLALDEIRELLDVREEGPCASVRARLLPLVEERIARTADRADALRAFSDRLARVRAELSGPAPAGACGPDCGCTAPGPPAAGGVPAVAGVVPEVPAVRIVLDASPAPAVPSAPDASPAPIVSSAPAFPHAAAVSLAPALPLAPPAPDPVDQDAPVACTLDGAGFGERVERWRRLVGRAEGCEGIPGGTRLSFPAGAGLAGEVAALAAAEQDCCAFFDFTLHLTPAALRLDVRAPESAAGMIAALLGTPA